VEQTDQAAAEVLEVGERWANAERSGDTRALADLLTGDFVGVGPLGFVLGKQAWLDRYSSGALVHEKFAWHDVTVRQYGDTAVAVGIEESAGSYSGHPITSRCRGTQILVRSGGTWQLAGVHLSATS
jgi:ketosteroid isomerase-like protein